MRKGESSVEIGERLKNIRIELRLQQKDMAETLKIASSYLCEIESGRANPGPEFFKRLAIAYNVNLHYVFIGTDDMFSSPVLPEHFEITKGMEIETPEELFWLMQNSAFFKNTIMALANKAFSEEEDYIIESLQKKKAKTGAKEK